MSDANLESIESILTDALTIVANAKSRDGKLLASEARSIRQYIRVIENATNTRGSRNGVDPMRVFPPPNSGIKSPLQRQLSPYRASEATLSQIENTSRLSGVTKADVVRYCIEFGLANADWSKIAEMKKATYE